MGTGVSVSASVSNQTATTNLSSNVQAVCTNTTNCVISNVIITAPNITGNITFNQTCFGNANCVMNTNAATIAQVMFNTVQQTQAARDFTLLGVQLNVAVSDSIQQITSNVTQIIQQTCSATADLLTQNVAITATDTISGNVTFDQSGSSTAS